MTTFEQEMSSALEAVLLDIEQRRAPATVLSGMVLLARGTGQRMHLLELHVWGDRTPYVVMDATYWLSDFHEVREALEEFGIEVNPTKDEGPMNLWLARLLLGRAVVSKLYLRDARDLPAVNLMLSGLPLDGARSGSVHNPVHTRRTENPDEFALMVREPLGVLRAKDWASVFPDMAPRLREPNGSQVIGRALYRIASAIEAGRLPMDTIVSATLVFDTRTLTLTDHPDAPATSGGGDLNTRHALRSELMNHRRPVPMERDIALMPDDRLDAAWAVLLCGRHAHVSVATLRAPDGSVVSMSHMPTVGWMPRTLTVHGASHTSHTDTDFEQDIDHCLRTLFHLED